jgi:hypothetical protein
LTELPAVDDAIADIITKLHREAIIRALGSCGGKSCWRARAVSVPSLGLTRCCGELVVASLALLLSVQVAFAQSGKPDASSAPSAANSGAGISGKAGGKSGPAVNPGTLGSSAAIQQANPTTQQQDPANVKGMPGNKNGPPAKPQ